MFKKTAAVFKRVNKRWNVTSGGVNGLGVNGVDVNGVVANGVDVDGVDANGVDVEFDCPFCAANCFIKSWITASFS